MKPVVAIYSTFLQRAYDQLIHDVAIQNLPVVLRDRPRRAWSAPTARRTTAASTSLPALPAEHDGDDAVGRERVPPDAVHGVPDGYGPAAVRYPRGSRPGRAGERSRGVTRLLGTIEAGKGEMRREGKRSRSSPSARWCARARGGRRARRHGRQHALREAARRRAREGAGADHELLVTVEEQPGDGRRGQRGLEALAAAGLAERRCCCSACPTASSTRATRRQLLASVGLDKDGILRSIRDWLDPRNRD